MAEGTKTRWRAAAGELTLIVAGVLVALWIEGCRQERVERTNEQAYLQRLQSDVEQDINRIDGLRAHSLDTDQNARRVLEYLRSDAPSGDADLVRSLNRAGFINFFRQNRSTYDDLLSTGNLRLLGNKSLVRELGDYYRSTDFLQHFDDQKKRAVWFDYRTRLAQYLPPTLPSVLDAHLNNGAAEHLDWVGLKSDQDLPTSRRGLGHDLRGAAHAWPGPLRRRAIARVHRRRTVAPVISPRRPRPNGDQEQVANAPVSRIGAKPLPAGLL